MDFPTGVSFYTGETAQSRRSLEERHISILTAEGFEEVITPIIEYYHPPGEREEAELIYKFPDQLTGRMMALRWDFTLQIAQLAAVRLGRQGGVCRWCYRGNVFRAVREHAGQKRQIHQVGAELLGDPSLESTAGMIRLAVKLLKTSGLADFALVVGHVGFVERLLRLVGAPTSLEASLREILCRKDLTGLERLARELSLPAATREAVRRSMYLLGGEEILAEAERIGGAVMRGVLDELRAILRLAGEAGEHILFDLTEPRGFDYYTGIMFQAVVPTMGQEVCRGGRYDSLLGRFGHPAPAVGFALDLDLILQAPDVGGRGGS